MENAKWYFTHESEEDRLWYGTFFSMCKKFNVSWPTATPTQKAFNAIEEITRVNCERVQAKRELSSQPVRGFFDKSASAQPTP